MKRRLFSVFFLLIALGFFAQDKTLDSLVKLWRKTDLNKSVARKDTSPAQLLYLIAENIYFSDPDSAITVCKIQLDYSRKINYIRGIANADGWLGYLLNQKGLVEEGLKHQLENLKLREQLKDQEGIAQALINIGFIYNHQNNTEKALEYYMQSAKIFEQLKKPEDLASAINNIAMIYDHKKQTKLALEYFRRSLTIAEEARDSQSIAVAYHNIGSCYRDINSLDTAEILLLKAKTIREAMGDQLGIAGSLISLADLKLRQKKLAEAERLGTQALCLSQKLRFASKIRDAADLMKDIFVQENKHKQALEMFELFIQTRDTINNSNTQKAAIKSQLKYEYEKQAAADSVKNAEEQKVKDAQLKAQSASLKQEKTQRYALIAGLILVAGFLIFVINRFRITNKQKKIIEIQKKQVDEAFEKLHEKNKEVLDSIYYARRIQRALITSEKYIGRKLNELM